MPFSGRLSGMMQPGTHSSTNEKGLMPLQAIFMPVFIRIMDSIDAAE